jgi:hypothetical protein
VSCRRCRGSFIDPMPHSSFHHWLHYHNGGVLEYRNPRPGLSVHLFNSDPLSLRLPHSEITRRNRLITLLMLVCLQIRHFHTPYHDVNTVPRLWQSTSLSTVDLVTSALAFRQGRIVACRPFHSTITVEDLYPNNIRWEGRPSEYKTTMFLQHLESSHLLHPKHRPRLLAAIKKHSSTSESVSRTSNTVKYIITPDSNFPLVQVPK